MKTEGEASHIFINRKLIIIIGAVRNGEVTTFTMLSGGQYDPTGMEVELEPGDWEQGKEGLALVTGYLPGPISGGAVDVRVLVKEELALEWLRAIAPTVTSSEAPPMLDGSKVAVGTAKFSVAVVTRAYQDRVKTWPTGTRHPSQKDDESWGREKFSAPRDFMRGLRKVHAPENWHQDGRPITQ